MLVITIVGIELGVDVAHQTTIFKYMYKSHDQNDKAYHYYTLGSIWNIDGGLTITWSYLDSCVLPRNKREKVKAGSLTF